MRGLLSTASALLLSSLVALAVPLQHDPNGFEGIPWGESRADRGIIFFEIQALRGNIADGHSATVF
ncbi:MAG: hypothetical protein NTNFB02_21360 [Nitrospira sp.]